jgi:lantibiotic leader peptide-processing serine protease
VKRFRRALVILGVVLAVGALPLSQAGANTADTKRYIVVFDGDYAVDGTYAVESTYAVLCTYAVTGTYAVGGNYAVGCDYAVTEVYAVYAVANEYAVSLVEAAGGTVTNNLLKQTGVIVAESKNAFFADVMRTYAVVDEAAESFKWKAFSTAEEAIASRELTIVDPQSLPDSGPEASNDFLESKQWALRLICVKPDNRPGCGATGAESVQAGSKMVEVGILDTGIESNHPDFTDTDGTNVNCAKGRDFIPAGPGVGLPTPCTDNNFHGTHVAGIVGARANNPTGIPNAGSGVRGVAPNVELIPVKVCDAVGFCYADSTAAGITYAGDMKFEVINMSFFVDDDVFLGSTEFKCMSDPEQRAFRKSNERAIQYARNQGVVPVAALGNSDQDLAHPVDENGDPINNECEVVPAETQGVIGTMALGAFSEKAGYSNYGVGATDVAAPGGNFGVLSDTPNEFCDEQVLSTVPAAFGFYGCFQGTSMASPHAAGVAALIVSQFGRVGTDSGGRPDVVMRPSEVENYLQSTTVDIGLKGYDECFGNGRINALRAVKHNTSTVRDPDPLATCPEYNE